MTAVPILILCCGIFLLIACLIAALSYCASFIAKCRGSEREIREFNESLDRAKRLRRKAG